MERPFALLGTWTTYGTWLPGDERGYVSHTLHAPGDWDGRENTPGTEYAKTHERTLRLARSAQKGETVWLTVEQARAAAESLVQATESRGWRIVRGAVMANHLHLLVVGCPNDGSEVRRVLKGNSQAALSKLRGSPQRWWTAGGSDRYKNDEQAILNAMRYIENQDRVLVAIRSGAIFAEDHRDKPGDS
jgi:REP element-mobilizing transposase RayT